jgi:hypothetical protein
MLKLTKSFYNLRKYPAAPPQPARKIKITLFLYPVFVVCDTSTALQDTYANGNLARKSTKWNKIWPNDDLFPKIKILRFLTISKTVKNILKYFHFRT